MKPESQYAKPDEGHLAHDLLYGFEWAYIMLVKPEADTRDAESYRQQHKNFCHPF